MICSSNDAKLFKLNYSRLNAIDLIAYVIIANDTTVYLSISIPYWQLK